MRKIAIAVCLVAVLFAACGKDDNPAVDSGIPAAAKIDVTAKDYAFASAPSTVDVENLVTLTVKNEGTEDHEAALLKLADGKTIDDLKAALSSQAPPAGPPPFAVAGGVTGTAPGTSASITQALPAGNYAFICFIPGRDGIPHFAKGMLAGFTVTGNSTTSLPLPDGLNATGTEYSFDLPSLKAGTSTIRFKNAGTDDHVLGIAKVADGKNANDALKWLTDHQGPPPLTFLGGPAAGPGGTTAVSFKFEKGTYVFYCPVPVRGDPAQTPHYAKGMFQGVTIS
jgi:uncharacterized cupredoxin-like copper-binding protein